MGGGGEVLFLGTPVFSLKIVSLEYYYMYIYWRANIFKRNIVLLDFQVVIETNGITPVILEIV